MLLLVMLPIIYASTSGNTELVCQKISQFLAEEQIVNKLWRVEQTSLDLVKQSSFLIMATSTWDRGTMNHLFKKFYREMLTIGFTNKKIAFVGLGDRRYEPVKFCAGIDDLKNRVLQQGGEAWGYTLKIDGDPSDQSAIVKNWLDSMDISRLQ